MGKILISKKLNQIICGLAYQLYCLGSGEKLSAELLSWGRRMISKETNKKVEFDIYKVYDSILIWAIIIQDAQQSIYTLCFSKGHFLILKSFSIGLPRESRPQGSGVWSNRWREKEK